MRERNVFSRIINEISNDLGGFDKRKRPGNRIYQNQEGTGSTYCVLQMRRIQKIYCVRMKKAQGGWNCTWAFFQIFFNYPLFKSSGVPAKFLRPFSMFSCACHWRLTSMLQSHSYKSFGSPTPPTHKLSRRVVHTRHSLVEISQTFFSPKRR